MPSGSIDFNTKRVDKCDVGLPGRGNEVERQAIDAINVAAGSGKCIPV
jgi:hypothetical protein